MKGEKGEKKSPGKEPKEGKAKKKPPPKRTAEESPSYLDYWVELHIPTLQRFVCENFTSHPLIHPSSALVSPTVSTWHWHWQAWGGARRAWMRRLRRLRRFPSPSTTPWVSRKGACGI